MNIIYLIQIYVFRKANKNVFSIKPQKSNKFQSQSDLHDAVK